MTSLGLICPPDQPPERLREVATTADEAGVSELWLWEDCFAPGGMTAAAVALAATPRLRVGVGLFPAPLRNVALTAMETATLARMFPDRLLPGIGHGVQNWMGQAGARVASPLTLLSEHTDALRHLLAGEEVSLVGRYVSLDAVQLRWPPPPVPLLVGAEGPKTLALAGQVGDGVILTGGLSPARVRESVTIAQQARVDAGVERPLDVVAFLTVPVGIGDDELASRAREYTDAGATRVAVCGLGAAGPPDDSARILDLVQTVAAAGD